MEELKNYLVTYSGSHLGGRAVVRAFCEVDAISLVECDPKTINFDRVEIEELDECGVLFNDNGEY